MTSPPRLRPEPVNPLLRLVRPVLAGSLLLALTVAAGCGGGEDDQAAAPPPPPPPEPAPPPTPQVASVESLMAQLGIDDRVFMQESAAPGTTEARQAVLEFFDAFVRGRDATVRPMLAEADRPFLDLMVELDTFVPVTEAIEEVELVAGASPDGRPTVLAMFVRDGVDEYQMWYYELEAGLATFEAAPTPPGIVSRLSGPIDGYIERWHEILDEEMQLASQPDEDIAPLDVNLDEGEDGGAEVGGGGGPSFAPGGGQPRRHRPDRRRRPPGIPGGPPA